MPGETHIPVDPSAKRCANCRWWNDLLEANTTHGEVVITPKEGESRIVYLGRCQKNAPTAFFASVLENDWCGEFEMADKTKAKPY